MGRRDEVFHVLKVITRLADAPRALADHAIQETAKDRALAEHYRQAATGGEWGKRFPAPPDAVTPLPVLVARIEMILGGGAGLHTLCLRLIEERETLAKALAEIQAAIVVADIPLRTENNGEAARGASART